MILIEHDTTRVIDALSRLARAAGPAGLADALVQIGEKLAEATRQRFVAGRGPDGDPWQTNAPSTRARHALGESKRPLVDTGNLAEDIHWRIIGDTLTIGTNWGDFREGAAVHQFGSRDGRIPARPFLGLSAEDETTVLDIIEERIAGAL